MLYPKLNEKRELYSLNGLFRYKEVENEYLPVAPAVGTRLIAVPASMNEQMTEHKHREYVGKVLYEKTFSLPVSPDLEYRLRIGSTGHRADIYLNGEKIGENDNGFLPFDTEIHPAVGDNRLSVVIDNRLTFETLPVGIIREGGVQDIRHDFYNYTGIHRDCLVYTLPKTGAIRDITVETFVDGDEKKLRFTVKTDAKNVRYTVKDASGSVVYDGKSGDAVLADAHLWSPEDPYLYTLTVSTDTDRYDERFGIRKIEVTSDSLLLNGKPIHLKGFGLHEDAPFFGKGNSSVINIRTFELLKWINANCIRTSHYPYAEEILDLADEYGILVIDEVQAVGINWWRGGSFAEDHAYKTLPLHKRCIEKLIDRDKNHPSVIMWSLANEPATEEPECRRYFEEIFATARSLTKLPLTVAECTAYPDSKIEDLPDVLSINRYFSWYTDSGELSVIAPQMDHILSSLYRDFKKPIIVTEFGADTIAGFHSLPEEMFSEEYQYRFLEENCKEIDRHPYCVGELVWHFADFRTKQEVRRPGGNKKGVFTKDREPKMAAFFLKKRFESLK